MEKEIIELCRKLKYANHCFQCGGSYDGGVCRYCGQKSETIIYLGQQLERKISRLPIELFTTENFNNVLTEFYSIRNMGILKVDEILLVTNYITLVARRYSQIKESIQKIIAKTEDLSQEQYYLLQTLLFNHDIASEDELLIVDLLMRAVMENNPNYPISNVDKEKLYVKFAELISINILGFKVVNINIMNEEQEERNKNRLGIAYYNNIDLPREVLHDDYENTLSIIFHECIHLKQYKEQNIEHILSQKNFIEIMDRVLAKISPSYYKINYTNISYEKEACLLMYAETIDFLRGIGIPISNILYQKYVICTKENEDYLTNMSRISEGEDIELQTLFSSKIVNHPEFFKDYPQLFFAYKIENNQVLPKTLIEIEADYQKYQEGSLVWNGDKEEIDAMYREKIGVLKNIKGM